MWLEIARKLRHDPSPKKWGALIALHHAAYMAGDPDHALIARYIYDSSPAAPLLPLNQCRGTKEMLQPAILNPLLSCWPDADGKARKHTAGLMEALLRWAPGLGHLLRVQNGRLHPRTDDRAPWDDGWDPLWSFNLYPTSDQGILEAFRIKGLLEAAGWRVALGDSVMDACRRNRDEFPDTPEEKEVQDQIQAAFAQYNAARSQ